MLSKAKQTKTPKPSGSYKNSRFSGLQGTGAKLCSAEKWGERPHSQEVRLSASRQIRDQTPPASHAVLVSSSRPSLQAPLMGFLPPCAQAQKQKSKAFMQISCANRCLGTHTLQGFIRYTQTNLNSLWVQKICCLTELSAGLEIEHVNLCARGLPHGSRSVH